MVINAYDFSLYFSKTPNNAIFSDVINHTYSSEFYKTGLFSPQYHLLCYGCDKVPFIVRLPLSSWACYVSRKKQVSESGTYRYLNLSSRVTAENRALSLAEIFSLFKLLTAELNRSNQRNPRENGTRLIDFFGDRTVFTVLHITYY